MKVELRRRPEIPGVDVDLLNGNDVGRVLSSELPPERKLHHERRRIVSETTRVTDDRYFYFESATRLFRPLR